MSKEPSKMSKTPEENVRKPPVQKTSPMDLVLVWKKFLWNPETKECLGRTAQSWGKITAFYIVFYSFLACFFAIMMTVFYHTLSYERPTYTSEKGESVLKAPGLAMRPDFRPTKKHHLMPYNPEKEYSYSLYADSINKFLASSKSNIICQEDNSTCRFDPSLVRDVDSTDFDMNWGYNSTSPTIILKLNRIFDWVPRVFPKEDKSLPKELRNYINETVPATVQDLVWVWCRTKNDLVDFSYAPYPGFPTSDYPFHNQRGFLSHLVAVTINNIPVNEEVRVECRPYAKNTKDEDRFFTLKIDNSL